MKRNYTTIALLCLLSLSPSLSVQDFQLLPEGYFNSHGVDVMAFSDFYPEGHQGGVCVIMNGRRVATNGDIRLEATPGQWQPVPKQIARKVEGNSIVTTLCYPDSSRHLTGFNPMEPGPGYRGVRGFEYYFLTNAYPDIFPAATVYNVLNFILGCHPGSNTASFASGVGTKSATVAYGLNRADWSFIPGGVVSGTALII